LNPKIDRRHFIRASGLLMAGAAAPALLGRAPAAELGGRIKKAVGWGMIGGKLSPEDKFRLAKDVGFEGVEVSRHASKADETDLQVLA
jgi:hypothetical protein